MITAVIGHGRSPEGRGWGERIDGCGLVVRMWEWFGWQEPRDYGTKYDWGLIEAYTASHRRWEEHNRRQPAIGWIASVLQPDAIRLMPKGTELIHHEHWRQIGKDMFGGHPLLSLSRGCIAACWAVCTSDPSDEVILVGCDNICERTCLPFAEAFSPEYQRAAGTAPFTDYKPFGPTYSRMGNHDYAVERPLIEILAAQRGAKVTFAQEVWD